MNEKLLRLLRSFGQDDWSKSTVARLWTVKDVASHLLDGSLRGVSLYRDKWELPPVAISDYRSLVNYLNQLNGDWVSATRRLSPALLVQWLEESHEAYIQCLEQLDPAAPAKYSVAWAGESISTNAFHIAREYTEKWHHQQQICEAVGNQEILTRAYYHPVLETFMMALPHAYREFEAPKGTTVSVHITSEAGGAWAIESLGKAWKFCQLKQDAAVKLSIPGDLAWKLFTKAVTPETARHVITLDGDEALAWPALRMLSVMA